MGIIGGIIENRGRRSCNEESWIFHALDKPIIRSLIAKIGCREEWIDLDDDNTRVLYEIMQEWEQLEPRDDRKEVIRQMGIFFLCLMSDEYYKDRIDWAISRIIAERQRLVFTEKIYPENWGDGRQYRK